MAAKAGAKRPRKIDFKASDLNPWVWVSRTIILGPPDANGERMRVNIEGHAGLLDSLFQSLKRSFCRDPVGRECFFGFEPFPERPAASTSTYRWVVRGERGKGLRSWKKLSKEEQADVLNEYPLALSFPALLEVVTQSFYRRDP